MPTRRERATRPRSLSIGLLLLLAACAVDAERTPPPLGRSAAALGLPDPYPVDAGSADASASIPRIGHDDAGDGSGEPVPTPVPGRPPLPGPPGALLPPTFAPVADTGLERHQTNWVASDRLSYGGGGALLDADGDGDLDLFVASPIAGGSAACLHRNDSSPGRIHLERETSHCRPDSERWYSGLALDADTDPADELLLTGPDRIAIWDLDRGLVDLWRPTGVTDRCEASSAVRVDLDLDGDEDLLVACSARLDSILAFAPPLAFIREPGGFVLLNAADDPVLSRQSNVLAWGLGDVDTDGLPDLAFVVDTFSTPRSRRISLDPGGWARRCAPGQTCRFSLERFLPTAATWGSYMGLATPWVESLGRAVYLTDYGPNRLIEGSGETASERGREFGVDISTRYELFKWSALADDFNGDGRDDLFVTAGQIPVSQPENTPLHRDAVLVQSPSGRFARWSDAAGLGAFELVPGQRDVQLGSRGAQKADLDGDGRLDLVVLPFLGAVRILTQVDAGAPARCTVEASPRVAPGPVEFRTGPDTPWKAWDVEGQHRFGAARTQLLPRAATEVRFVSGAVVPLRCEGLRARVSEPNWIGVGRAPGGLSLRVDIDPGAWDGDIEGVEVAVRGADGVVKVTATRDAGGWVAPLSGGASAAMVRVVGTASSRWVPRWWELP
jgi:hypothetical protein